MRTELLISALSLIVGVIATIVVSHYYFRRTLSVRKQLTPYIQSFSTPLRKINEELRAELEVLYRGNKITDLCEIRFIIANTGDKPLRDIIEPLSLKFPEGCTILDVQNLHVSPEGRHVGLAFGDRGIAFDIALLNPGDFFVLKVLLNGKLKWQDLKFTIVADELDPVLEPEPLPYGAAATPENLRPKRQWGLGVITAFAVVLLSAIFVGIVTTWSRVEWIGLSSLWTFIKADGAKLVFGVIVVPCILVAATACKEALFPRTRSKFVLPPSLVPKRTFGATPYFLDEF